MARLLALITIGPIWVYSLIAGSVAGIALRKTIIGSLVGALRWHAQKPGLLASGLLVYLVLAAAAPGLKVGALMAQEVDSGNVITLVDRDAVPQVATGVSMAQSIVSALQVRVAEQSVWLILALIMAAVGVLALLAKGRKNSKSARTAMDPFERLFQRRLAEKAHAESRSVSDTGLLRA